MTETIEKQRRVECEPPDLSDFAFHLWPAFLGALDVKTVERVDPEATQQLRERALAEGKTKKETSTLRRLKRVLTIGDPPLYSFKDGDLIHTRDERFSVQVWGATPDSYRSDKRDGELTFYFYRHSTRLGMYTCSQAEFVELLKTGQLSRLNINICNNR